MITPTTQTNAQVSENRQLGGPQDEQARLKAAAREFEALLLEVMLRSMRSTLEDTGSESGYGKEIFGDIMYQQLAHSISQGPGLGIARLIEQGALRLAGQASVQTETTTETIILLPEGAPAPVPAPAAAPPPPAASPATRSVAPPAAPVAPAAAPAPAPTVATPPAVAMPPSARAPVPAEPKTALTSPLAARVSSAYGWRQDPLGGDRRFHRGVDFAAMAGTPIVAAEEGRVVFSGHGAGYGNVVVLEHSNGVRTLYAHLAERAVEEGDVVRKLQAIGTVGSTGRTTGPHLHFEVHEPRGAVDPMARLGEATPAAAGDEVFRQVGS